MFFLKITVLKILPRKRGGFTGISEKIFQRRIMQPCSQNCKKKIKKFRFCKEYGDPNATCVSFQSLSHSDKNHFPQLPFIRGPQFIIIIFQPLLSILVPKQTGDAVTIFIFHFHHPKKKKKPQSQTPQTPQLYADSFFLCSKFVAFVFCFCFIRFFSESYFLLLL